MQFSFSQCTYQKRTKPLFLTVNAAGCQSNRKIYGHFYSVVNNPTELKFVLVKCFINGNIGWMGDLRFYVFFNSISVITGRWADDNARLYAMEPRL